MDPKLEAVHKGRICVDPFKKHKTRIVKNLRNIPPQLLQNWKFDVRKEEMSYYLKICTRLKNLVKKDTITIFTCSLQSLTDSYKQKLLIN